MTSVKLEIVDSWKPVSVLHIEEGNGFMRFKDSNCAYMVTRKDGHKVYALKLGPDGGEYDFFVDVQVYPVDIKITVSVPGG